MITRTVNFWSSFEDGCWVPHPPADWSVVAFCYTTGYAEILRWIERHNSTYETFYCWRPNLSDGTFEIATPDAEMAFHLRMSV